jgi:hypothetical protein
MQGTHTVDERYQPIGEEWVMVRLKRSTHASLCAVRESLLIAYERGQLALEMDARGRVSFDQVIDLLIQKRSEHAARRKKAAKKRSRATEG